MRPPLVSLLLLAALGLPAIAQDREPAPDPPADPIVIPAGTKVPLALKHAISSKTARVGDNVYLETMFPVVINDEVVIPSGTHVQGVISAVERPGRIKGRAELLLHFRTLIYPNGYTVSLPGSVDNVPGAENSQVTDEEGTLQAEGQKAQDAATIGGSAATGTLIGAAAGGGKGALMGGGIGAAAGAIITMLGRGQDVRLEAGTMVEMVLQRDIRVQEERINGDPRARSVPQETDRKLQLTPRPPLN